MSAFPMNWQNCDELTLYFHDRKNNNSIKTQIWISLVYSVTRFAFERLLKFKNFKKELTVSGTHCATCVASLLLSEYRFRFDSSAYIWPPAFRSLKVTLHHFDNTLSLSFFHSIPNEFRFMFTVLSFLTLSFFRRSLSRAQHTSKLTHTRKQTTSLQNISIVM